jgi:signal transduction histidine kinase
MDAEAGERRRISLDLHDGLGQILTALAMMARDLALDLHEAGSTGVSKAELITELIEQAKQNLRDLTTGSALIHRDVEDLAESIRELADQTQSLFNLSCTVDFDLQGCELGGGRYAQLSRIASEAVHNAVKHAKADRLSISLRREGELVVLRVGDNGVGMQQPMAASGMGLKIMKHRADLIGAQLNVESRAGNGTTVICLMEAHCHAG